MSLSSLQNNKTASSGSRNRQWFWQAVKRYWRVYRDVLLASLLVNLFAFVSPIFVMNVYDRVVPNQAFETLWMLAAGVFLVFILELIIRLLRTYYIDAAGRQIDLTLSSRLIDRILGVKLSVRPQSTATLMNSLAEFDSVRSFITSTSVMAFIDLPFVILFLGLVSWIGGWLVMIPIVCITLSLFVAWIINRPLQSHIALQQEVTSLRQSFLMELLAGLVSVKSCNVENQNQQRWHHLNRKVADTSLTIRRLQSGSAQMTAFFLQVNTVALVISGVYLISSGDLSMGGLIAMMMISGRCGAPVSQVISLLNQYEKAVQALDHADHIISLPQERRAEGKPLKPDGFIGQWTVNNMSYSYPNSPTLLSNINLTIQQGEKLAVLGRMESGKSTFLQLLCGLQEPKEGYIALNHIDIRQLEPAWLRRHIGYVPQKCELFNASLRDNITMGRSDIGDSDILEALEKSGLAGIIEAGSAGLDFQVGENGRNLSGGQAQAVGLARALVTRPEVLLLDEPTSAMDSHSEARFLQLLNQLKGLTIVLVTHKFSLLNAMDRIVVFDQGEIKAAGTAQEMLANSSAARMSPANNTTEAVN